MADNWEVALIAVIERELEQLKWLIESERTGAEDIGKGDVQAQISRVCGLTDLSNPDGLPLSETTIAKLRQQNEAAMNAVRARVFGAPQGPR